MSIMKVFLIIAFAFACFATDPVEAVSKRALQKSHEKTQSQKWMEAFYGRNLVFDQVPSLVNLINVISAKFLSGCTSIILYDTTVELADGLLLEQLFRSYAAPFVHGQITKNYNIKVKTMLKSTGNACIAYVLFMADVMKAKQVIGEQSENKVVIISRSSQWRVHEFLSSELARVFVNLLVIQKSEKILQVGMESSYILYTHKMYVDGIGSSSPVVLTSWRQNAFTRSVNLFPMKMSDGFAGHRFIVAVAHQPPFVIKLETTTSDVVDWDGIEIRMVKLLSEQYNFTTDFREAKGVDSLGSGNAITQDVHNKKVNLGVGGVYVTNDRFGLVDVSQSHSHDCAAFITLTSTALPRYRAIFGPFHWSVWLCLTIVYLFAIFPLVLSDQQTLAPLLRNPEEIENMFWYVFGTFTNCFAFKGKASWGKSEKVTTRLLVGFYWMFTIITTACYTGSIIAFVTLPVHPETVDNTKQLVKGRFQIGTLDKGGWEYWFENSTDKYTDALFKSIEYLPNVQAGLRNVTKAFFWPYAFLGSRDELDFIVRTNFTTQSKRAMLHVSKNCFVPYGVAFLFPLNSIYKNAINRGLLNLVQSGFISKLKNDMQFEIMRSPSGSLLQANSGGTVRLIIEDRALSLDDTQGMFLLLGAGFLFGAASLLSEWLGGCFNFCKRKIRRLSTTSIESHPRSYDNPTPREKVGSLQYSIHTRLCSISDAPNEVREHDVIENGITSEFSVHYGNDVVQNHIDNDKNMENDEKHVRFNNGAKVTQNEDEEREKEEKDEKKTVEEQNLINDINYEEQIDKAFNLDDIFGEINDSDVNRDEDEERVSKSNSELDSTLYPFNI